MNKMLKLAICQMNVVNCKSINVEKAVSMINVAAENEADIVVLPEMFNCPYSSNKFRQYAEKSDSSRTLHAIAVQAEALGVYIIAGSIPEIDGNKLYNSSYAFDRQGKLLGRHRKLHMFDIDLKGKISFKESETLSYGNEVTVINTEFCGVGLCICYDIRFPELFGLMTKDKAKLVIVPAAFNMVTGPAHWELLIRTRALDNQVYVAAASPSRDESQSYVAFGNSMVASPWGNVVARADEKEQILYARLDLDEVEKVRSELPLLKHKRDDLYELKLK